MLLNNITLFLKYQPLSCNCISNKFLNIFKKEGKSSNILLNIIQNVQLIYSSFITEWFNENFHLNLLRIIDICFENSRKTILLNLRNSFMIEVEE